MTSAFVVNSGGGGSQPLRADLETLGIDVLGSAAIETMVPDVIRGAPDLVVCFENRPDDALFAGTAALRNAAPRPVVVFTTDPDAEKIERATSSGIHCYVINGYGLHRMRGVVYVAQARVRHDQLLRDGLSDGAKPLLQAQTRGPRHGNPHAGNGSSRSTFEVAPTRTGRAEAKAEIASLSESLLGHFDELTTLYERGMQMLME